MKKAIIGFLGLTILVGALALAFNNAFGYETIMFLQKERITFGTTNFYIWKFDFYRYINNLQLTTSNLSILQFKTPTRQWNSDIANNFALVIDYLIMIINLMLYPLKVGAYLLSNVIAIIGINTDTTSAHNGLAWLVIFVRDILGNISIPYI